ERLVDRRAQAVDVHAERVAIRQFLAPHARFQVLARYHGRAGFHQVLQQLQSDRIELDRLAATGDDQRVEIVVEVGQLQNAALYTFTAARENLQARFELL